MSAYSEPPYLEARADPTSGAVQFGNFSLADGAVDVAWGYRRCKAHDRFDGRGQDFATARADAGFVVGVVADGVGQSFRGDLAADGVARRLLELLWARRRRPPRRPELLAALETWQPEIRREVEAIPISPNLPRLVWLADEEARRNGAQTVFSAFIFDSYRAKLHLYQVGDAPAVVCFSSGERLVRTAPHGGRWSSTGTADLQLLEEITEEVAWCVIHSDGLKGDWYSAVDDLSREVFEPIAETQSGVDDVCFVAVYRRRQPPRAALQPPPLPASDLPGLFDPVPPVPPVPAVPLSQGVLEPSRRPELPSTSWLEPRPFLAGVIAGAALLATLLTAIYSIGTEEQAALLRAPEPISADPSKLVLADDPSQLNFPAQPPPFEDWIATPKPLDVGPPNVIVNGANVLLQFDAGEEVASVEIVHGPIDRKQGRFAPLHLRCDQLLKLGFRALGANGDLLVEDRFAFLPRTRNRPKLGEQLGLYKITVSLDDQP